MSKYQLNLPQNFINGAIFTDVDEIVEVLNIYRETTYLNVLSFETFKAEICQADFGDLLVFFAESHNPIHHVGLRRKGFIHFDFYLKLGGMPLLHNQEINFNTLNSFNLKKSSNSFIPRNSIICDVQIREKLFISTCQSMRRDDLLATSFLQRDLIDIKGTISEYRNYIQQLFYLIKTRSPLFSKSEYRQIILGDLLPILIDAIPQQKPHIFKHPSLSRRGKLIRQAIDFIHANLNQPLTLKDIYTHLGISRRTLFYGFEEIFGTTPLAYIKAQRLQGARRTLKKAQPDNNSILKVAHQWGYWNLSRFAQDYKLMFGELPSETLKFNKT